MELTVCKRNMSEPVTLIFIDVKGPGSKVPLGTDATGHGGHDFHTLSARVKMPSSTLVLPRGHGEHHPRNESRRRPRFPPRHVAKRARPRMRPHAGSGHYKIQKSSVGCRETMLPAHQDFPNEPRSA